MPIYFPSNWREPSLFRVTWSQFWIWLLWVEPILLSFEIKLWYSMSNHGCIEQHNHSFPWCPHQILIFQKNVSTPCKLYPLIVSTEIDRQKDKYNTPKNTWPELKRTTLGYSQCLDLQIKYLTRQDKTKYTHKWLERYYNFYYKLFL
jgi:hypothetical protein